MAKKNERKDLYDDRENFGKLLRQLRIDKKLRQQEVADYLSVKRVTVSAYESGRVKPTSDKMYMLSKLFGVNIEVLSRKASDDRTVGAGKSVEPQIGGDRDKENEVLYYLRNLPEGQQRAILEFAKNIAESRINA